MNGRTARGDAASPIRDADHLPQLLMQLGSRSFAYFGTVAAELGVPAPVAMALQQLEPSRPGPMNELAGAMGCDPSYVTWIADQLEALGLAERRLATHDRRVKMIALTSRGTAMRQELVARLAQVPFALSDLSADEASTLSELLVRILGGPDAVDIDHCAIFVRYHPNGDHRKDAARRSGAANGAKG